MAVNKHEEQLIMHYITITQFDKDFSLHMRLFTIHTFYIALQLFCESLECMISLAIDRKLIGSVNPFCAIYAETIKNV